VNDVGILKIRQGYFRVAEFQACEPAWVFQLGFGRTFISEKPYSVSKSSQHSFVDTEAVRF
jgi:hypothetical protein